MPWNMEDYPDAFKNFDPLLKKKTISIANALLDSGYKDDRAIPIAISQAKEWMSDATEKEKQQFKEEQDPKKTDKHETSSVNTDLLDNDVKVYYEDKEWKVETVGAKQAADSYDTKKEAVKRAEKIADNKNSRVITYKENGERQS